MIMDFLSVGCIYSHNFPRSHFREPVHNELVPTEDVLVLERLRHQNIYKGRVFTVRYIVACEKR